MSSIRLFTFSFLGLLIIAGKAFSVDVRLLQNSLQELGYDVSVDGKLGPETKRQLSTFFTENSFSFDGVVDTETLLDVKKLKSSLQRPIPWTFRDDFNSINWGRYDSSHAPKRLGGLDRVRILKEENGNSYISLTSKIGQLSNLNRGQDRYIKDRVELGLPPKIAEFDLHNRLLWYGFQIKSEDKAFIPKAHSVTFTQYKQIQKNRGRKKDCFPGMFWRMNAENNGKIWMAVTNEKGEKLNKKVMSSFITDTWSDVIIGVYFTTSDRGWLKAYVNERLVYSYTGRTVMNRFKSCEPKYFENYLRIGVYRGSDTKKLGSQKLDKNQSDTLHFDNFVVSDNYPTVRAGLSK